MNHLWRMAVLAVALSVLITSLAAAQPVTVTVVLKSGERHSGQNLQHRFDLAGGEVSLRKSLHDQLRVPPDEVAYIDFGGTRDVTVTLSGSQQAVVLRSGTIVRGQVIEMAHSSFEDQDTPYLVTIRNEQGREQRLRVSEVARVYFTSSAAAATPTPDMAVPEGAVVVPATRQWTSTGIVVRTGEMLRFNTTGEIRLSSDPEDIATPAGAKSGRRAPRSPIPGDAAGALIGRIGANGRPFGIGDQTSIPMPAAGELYLGINDDGLASNQGRFVVQIQRTTTPTRRRQP